MEKFIYKMQNVLDIKFKLESQAKTNFANAQMKLNAEEEKLEALKRKRMEYEKAYKQLMQDVLDIREMNFCVISIENMKEKIKMQMLEVHVAQKNLEEARKRLQEVMQERKTHEKLKEHAFEDYMKEFNAEESKEIDELVSYNFSKAGR